jgi:phosphoribosylformylglycinamidine synthase
MEKYPFNPNGSALDLAGLRRADGGIISVMPYPERVFRAVQISFGLPRCYGRGPQQINGFL